METPLYVHGRRGLTGTSADERASIASSVAIHLIPADPMIETAWGDTEPSAGPCRPV